MNFVAEFIFCVIALYTASLVYMVLPSRRKRAQMPDVTNGLFLALNDENLVLINRNFSAIGQLNQPFIAIVINDDTVAMTFPRE